MTLTADQIDDFVATFDKDTKAIKSELLRICWHMRGGISYQEAHMLTQDERDLVAKLVEEHMNVTQETGMPFY